MREHTKIWVAVYAAGVMAGILYANLIAQESIMQMGIFAENHLTESVKVFSVSSGPRVKTRGPLDYLFSYTIR